MSQAAVRIVLEALERATQGVNTEYFALPVAGADAPVPTERVYCYELYHQFRLGLPDDYAYTLNAEIDKLGHPLLRDGDPARKPDMVVHVPGEHSNLLVIEVKSGRATQHDLGLAVQSLSYFTNEPFSYEHGVLLVFGGERVDVVQSLARLEHHREFRRGRISVWHHAEALCPVSQIDWAEIAAG